QAGSPGTAWFAANAFPLGTLRFDWAVRRVMDDWQPDVIWASSDWVQLWLGSRAARRYDIPLVVDFYDNYESFALTRIPGASGAIADACRSASAITAVTESLGQHIAEIYRPEATIHLLGNGVDQK